MGEPKIIPNYTYEDYKRWQGRWEVIDGIAYDMSPMASPEHQRIANEIGRAFSEAIEKGQCACQVYQPIDVKIRENTIVNPDLLIVCKPIEGQFLDFPPELVVEIISPSSRLKDTITKYNLYKEFGIKYYLLIDPEEKRKVLHHLTDNQYVSQESFDFELNSGCQFSLKLKAVVGF